MNTIDYFKQICNIPRASGNEEGMRQFLLSWAQENKLKALRDKSGNIIVKCPATAGYENVPSVALQGHMDMVCVKTEDSIHDFEKDPIETYIDGDWLKAKDTSLGADDGIAVAMAMALLTDPDAKHGKLEAVFTWNEETGMDGANNLDVSLIESRRLINIDSETEGLIFIGCAGGISVFSQKNVKYEDIPNDWETVEIKLSGLKGGHSGGEIHMQRLNAICALARMIHSIDSLNTPYMIDSFKGGVRSNVIPYSASAVISIPKETKKQTMSKVLSVFNDIKNEYDVEEPGFTEEHHCTGCNASLKEIKRGICIKDSKEIINALYLNYNGVKSFSKKLDCIVETSDNIAIAELSGDTFNVLTSVRSNVESAKLCHADRIAGIFKLCAFDVQLSEGYPSWQPDPDSPLAAFCAKAWKDLTGKDAVITAIHAGLECGIINSKTDGMDSVSIGPTMTDVHSVNEKLSLQSTERMYKYVKHVLEIMK